MRFIFTPGLSRVFCLLLLVAVAAGAAYAQSSGHIQLFQSDIQVNSDASLSVRETIVYQHSGKDPVSGLYRFFTTSFPLACGLRRLARFQQLEVSRDSLPISVRRFPKSDGLIVEMGNEDEQLSPGFYTYAITYRTSGQIENTPGFDELYLNATGGWDCPVDHAVVNIRLPAGVPATQVTADGYTRRLGRQLSGVNTFHLAGGTIAFIADHPLQAQEGVHFLVRFPQGFTKRLTASEEAARVFADNFTSFFGLITIVGLALCYLVLWIFVGRDPKPGTLQPVLTPPGGLSPAVLRYVWKMRYDPQTMAVALVSLGVKGILTVKEKEDRYVLHRKSTDNKSLREMINAAKADPAMAIATEETGLLSAMLLHSSEFTFDYAHATRIEEGATNMKEALKHRAEQVYFRNNYQYLAVGMGLSLFCLLLIAFFEIPTEYPGEQFRLVLGVAGAVIGTPLISLTVVRLWRDLFSHAVGRIGNVGLMAKYLFWVIAFLFAEWFLLAKASGLLFWTIVIVIAQHLLFAQLLKAPTRRGRKLLDDIEGFRMYLSGEHPNLVSQCGPPPKTPELFERYLPYALALDVEEQWAGQFTEEIARENRSGKLEILDWYTGPAWANHNPCKLAISLREEMAPSMTSLTVPVDAVTWET